MHSTKAKASDHLFYCKSPFLSTASCVRLCSSFIWYFNTCSVYCRENDNKNKKKQKKYWLSV